MSRPAWEPGPVNRAVDAAHAECASRGGCEYRGDVVRRPIRFGSGDVELRVCARCEVPEPLPRLAPGGGRRRGRPIEAEVAG